MSDLLSKTEEFVTDLLVNELDSNYLYHNLRHTQRVVKSTKELLDAHDLSAKENDIITLAAWLHDVGYTRGTENHEANSCEIAKEFLKKEGYEEKAIEEVCALIMATKREHEPKNLKEEIIRDADSSHFGQNSYADTSEMLRQELSLLGIADMSAKEWRTSNIKMFQTEHRFYTDFAKKNWQEGKDKNLKKLVKNLKKQKKTRRKEELKVKLKNQSPERGIQTMFRVTMRNHLKLSDIADTKANILLSVNAIIISMLLTNLIPKLDNPSNDYLIYPTGIFVLFSIVSMVMSVLATRPNVTSGEFTKEDVKDKKVNLLFFGNFHKMKLLDYEWAIQEMIKDQTYVYKSLTKDLYFLGVVLDKKYKLLRWTYTIFMIGIILSTIAFFVALKYFGPERIIELPT
ncbi:Pycsar system effector family protein [Maribacter halichondriae]|uniref:Pycsar system effector family protein n=1 Tax=Maribacter halichondriae TaxID=2980554 RepID=UPI00235A0091|nr:Pycsar system effector family protein [Maribacter sp. Hal144]